MKIISAFKDYYDSAWPSQEEPAYRRNFKEWDVTEDELKNYPALNHFIKALDNLPRLPESLMSIDPPYFTSLYSSFIIVGTALFHVFMESEWIYSAKLTNEQKKGRCVIWDHHEAVEYLIKKHKASRQTAGHIRERFAGNKHGPRCYRWSADTHDWQRALQGMPTLDCPDLLTELTAPIVQIVNVKTLLQHRNRQERNIYSQAKIILNPRLTDLGVQAILPPTEAWQAISMMLNGPLARQADPIPKRTQRLIADAHGFNEHSFRNSAGKKTKRRKDEA